MCKGLIIIQKKWYWILTWPFAHNNYTAIGRYIFYPKGHFPSYSVIEHEYIHLRQQREVGLFKFVFLYLFALPFFWNPYRFKWEMEAFTEGSKITHLEAQNILSSMKYGWLKNKVNT